MTESTNAERFLRDGYLVVEGVLDAVSSGEVLREVLESFATSGRSHVHGSDFRIHSPLPMTPTISRALRDVINSRADVVNGFLHREKFLVELSSITVFPGAESQHVHSDETDPDRRIISVFVNLLPTKKSAGALRVYPGNIATGGNRGAKVEGESVDLELPAGSAVFMNGKLRHCGTENSSSDCVRPVFYFSFGDSDIVGPTYSLLRNYWRQFVLQDFLRGERAPNCRPSFRPNRWISRSIASTSGHEILYLVNDRRIEGELELTSETRWAIDLVQLLFRGDKRLSIDELAAKINVSRDDVVAVLEQLWEANWLTWH